MMSAGIKAGCARQRLSERSFKWENYLRARDRSKTRFCISELLQSAIVYIRWPPESRRDYAGRGPNYSGRDILYANFVGACVRARYPPCGGKRATLCNLIKADKKKSIKKRERNYAEKSLRDPDVAINLKNAPAAHCLRM